MRIFKKQETLVQSLSNPGDVSEHRNGRKPSSKGIAEFKDNFEDQATLIADHEWQYGNVRRYFLFLEQQIQKSTQWSIFQPNDRCKADPKPVRKSDD